MIEPIYCGIDMLATGANIAQLRKARGLTIRDIQHYMGFEEPRSIYKWERGETTPTLEHLKTLSQVLGVKMDDILIWSHPPPWRRIEM